MVHRRIRSSRIAGKVADTHRAVVLGKVTRLLYGSGGDRAGQCKETGTLSHGMGEPGHTMKTYVKVILIIAACVCGVVAYFGYRLYQLINGSEKLAGSRCAIPATIAPDRLPPLSTGEADWPNWRGTNFDGKSATTGIVTNWSQGLKKAWQVDYLCQDQATASWSAPVVRGNRLIIPGRDAVNDLVFCIDSGSGGLMWVGSYEAPAGTSHGPGARATPFIDDDRVYTFGRSGDLACWQLLDGKLLWRKNVKDEGGVEPGWGYSGTPLVTAGKVIVQGGGKALVLAYDKMNGNVLWKSLEGEAGFSASVPVRRDGKPVHVLVYHAKALSCLDVDNGREIWRMPWETSYGVNATTPAVDGSIIFHSSGYKMGCQALRLKDDGVEVLWKNDVIAAQHSDPVIINGYVYGYSGDSSSNRGRFKCVELGTGRELWSTDKVGQGTVTFADGYLVCLDIKGNLFLVKADPASFQLAGEIRSAVKDVSDFAWTVPVIANGRLYLRYLQRLTCYQLLP